MIKKLYPNPEDDLSLESKFQREVENKLTNPSNPSNLSDSINQTPENLYPELRVSGEIMSGIALRLNALGDYINQNQVPIGVAMGMVGQYLFDLQIEAFTHRQQLRQAVYEKEQFDAKGASHN